MSEERWTMEQVARAVGLPRDALDKRRSASSVPWSPKGYSFAQISAFLKGLRLRPGSLPDVGRSKRAARLQLLLMGVGPKKVSGKLNKRRED